MRWIGDLSHLYDKLKDYEALEAEVERLRWHYPERGELPPTDFKKHKQLLIEIERIMPNQVIHYVVFRYAPDPEEGIYMFGSNEIECTIDAITRWRYV